MVRTYQGGSILGFVIVGSVLALLLVGGAYFVRHSLVSDSGGDRRYTQQDETKDDSDEVEGDRSGRSDEDDEAGQEDPAPQPGAGSSDEDDAQSDEESPLPVAGSSTDDPNPEALPQTGPAGALVSAAMLGLLTALFVSYRRSRDLA